MMTLEQRPQSYWTPWQALGPDRQWTAGPPVRMVYPVRRPSRPWWWSPPYAGLGATEPEWSTGQKVGVVAGFALLLVGVVISLKVGDHSGRR
jgi:hypothetical protein